MNKNRLILVGILFLGLFSCQGNSEVKQYLDQFKLVKKKTQKIPFDSLVVIPMQIFVLDTLVMVNEFRRSGYLISLWDKTSGKLVKRIFPVGKGPSEYLPPLYLDFNNGVLGVFNRTDYKYRLFRFDNAYVPTKIYESPSFANNSPKWVRKLNDSTLVGTSILSFLNPRAEKRYSIFNSKGEVLDYFIEDYPEIDGLERHSSRIKDRALQGKVCFKPDLSMFVKVSVETGNLEIFKIKDNKISKTFENQVNKTIRIKNYSDNETRFVEMADDQPFGYRDVFATNELIYLLYSGENKTTQFPKGYRFILMIDWQGLPQGGYELDTPLACFTYDPANRKFYGISPDGDNMVFF